MSKIKRANSDGILRDSKKTNKPESMYAIKRSKTEQAFDAQENQHSKERRESKENSPSPASSQELCGTKILSPPLSPHYSLAELTQPDPIPPGSYPHPDYQKLSENVEQNPGVPIIGVGPSPTAEHNE